MIESSKTSQEILRDYYNKKKDESSSMSLGALSKKVGLSSSYISRIFSGARPLPLHNLKRFADALEIDDILRAKIETLLLKEQGLAKGFEEAAVSNGSGALAFTETNREHLFLLEDWYYLAILELSTCDDVHITPVSVGNQLGISHLVAEKAIKRLIHNGLLTERNGQLEKTTMKLRFPEIEKNQHSANRYQRASLKKVHQVLSEQKESSDMARRFAHGGTVAVNSQNFDKAKKILNKAVFEALEILTDGPCDSVYQAAFHLTPLSLNLKNSALESERE